MRTKARTPRHFPRMKVRGNTRHRIAPYQRVAGAFDRLGMEANKAAALLADMSFALDRKDSTS